MEPEIIVNVSTQAGKTPISLAETVNSTLNDLARKPVSIHDPTEHASLEGTRSDSSLFNQLGNLLSSEFEEFSSVFTAQISNIKTEFTSFKRGLRNEMIISGLGKSELLMEFTPSLIQKN